MYPKIEPDCILCILKVANLLIKNCINDPKLQEDTFRKILKMKSLSDYSLTAPEVIKDIHLKVEKIAKCGDPFIKTKEKLNDEALKLYPKIKKRVLEYADPLYYATKIAILANSADIMVEPKILINTDKEILKSEFDEFRKRISSSNLVIYVGDNAGEIVFDKLLIETILRYYDVEIIYVVRSVPVLTDVTIDDADKIKLTDIVRVIENGIKEPLPGTVLSKVSSELLSLIKKADFIISKGGGNFETLINEKIHASFMLPIKCQVMSNYFNRPLGSPIIFNK